MTNEQARRQIRARDRLRRVQDCRPLPPPPAEPEPDPKPVEEDPPRDE